MLLFGWLFRCVFDWFWFLLLYLLDQFLVQLSYRGHLGGTEQTFPGTDIDQLCKDL